MIEILSGWFSGKTPSAQSMRPTKFEDHAVV
jgi:hypothetical protein